MKRAYLLWNTLALATALVLGCGGKKQEQQSASTVALARVVRPDVTYSLEGQTASSLDRPRRIETETTLATAGNGQALLELDNGAVVVLDRNTEVRVELGELFVAKGRVFVTSRSPNPTRVLSKHGLVIGRASSFAYDLSAEKSVVVVTHGEISFAAGPEDKATPALRGNTVSGETLTLTATRGQTASTALWDDWTGGVADPAPFVSQGNLGVGALRGREYGRLGQPRKPLSIRAQEVDVDIRSDLALTEVKQTFFNADSVSLEGEYQFELPEGARVVSFAIDRGAGFETATVIPLALRPDGSISWRTAPAYGYTLHSEGPRTLRGRIGSIVAGATIGVRLIYQQWLDDVNAVSLGGDGRSTVRRYVYPFETRENASAIGEFRLHVDASLSGASALRAGLGATLDGKTVRLQASDYRPAAPFVLELVGMERSEKARAIETRNGPDRFAMLSFPADVLIKDAPKERPPLELAIVVDTSSGTEADSLELARTLIDTLLRRLDSRDRVAVFSGDIGVTPLGSASATTSEPTKAYVEAVHEGLARVSAAGATDIGAMMRGAALAVAGKPRGTVLYIGDGTATTGAVDVTSIRASLDDNARRARFLGVALGDDANVELLRRLSEGEVTRMTDRQDAVPTILRLLDEVSRPYVTDVHVEAGTALERMYPRPGFSVLADGTIRVVGTLRQDLPKKVHVRGVVDGVVQSADLDVALATVSDDGAVARQWAILRLENLLDEDAGREAVVEVAARFGLLSPWTHLAIEDVTAEPIEGWDADPLRCFAGSCGTTLDVGGGETSGWRRRLTSRAQATDEMEFSWADHAVVGSEIAPAAGNSGDGGLLRAAAMRTLQLNERGPRSCYERRVQSRPDLESQFQVGVTVDANGTVKKVSGGSDLELARCIEAELRGVRFPATGGKGEVEVWHRIVFPAREVGVQRRCSEAATESLTTRLRLWRERATQMQPDEVYRDAVARCEAPTWRDKRTLLRTLVEAIGVERSLTQLYRQLRSDASVEAYLRSTLVRRLRTPHQLQLAVNILGIDRQLDWNVFAALYRAATTPTARLALVRRWLTVVPGDLGLQLRLLALLEEVRAFDEAERVSRELIRDWLADARTHTEVGDFWMRRGNEKEARRAYSSLVERTPFDPGARRRLGDVYLANGWSDDAYREYGILARLQPDRPGTLLLLARAAATSERYDEALRLATRLVALDDEAATSATGALEASNSDSWGAKFFMRDQIARLRERPSLDQPTRNAIARLERATGTLREDVALVAVLTWKHPSDSLEFVFARDEAKPTFQNVDSRSAEFGIAGLAISDLDDAGYLLEIRRPASDVTLRETSASVLVIQNPGTATETRTIVPFTLTRNSRAKRVRITAAGVVTPVAIP